MKFLVAGLGNPGRRYEKTRHNAGFLFIDSLSSSYGIDLRRKVFDSMSIGEGVGPDGSGIILVKPETFMNLSGKVFPNLFRSYGIDNDRLLVIVDNMDLPLGTLRLKKGGSSAGHNGLKSIFSYVGQSFYRLYVGVGCPETAGRDTVSHVLATLTTEEETCLSDLFHKAIPALAYLFNGQYDKACHEINSLRAP